MDAEKNHLALRPFDFSSSSDILQAVARKYELDNLFLLKMTPGQE